MRLTFSTGGWTLSFVFVEEQPCSVRLSASWQKKWHRWWTIFCGPCPGFLLGELCSLFSQTWLIESYFDLPGIVGYRGLLGSCARQKLSQVDSGKRNSAYCSGEFSL